jgi:hypothetical protein
MLDASSPMKPIPPATRRLSLVSAAGAAAASATTLGWSGSFPQSAPPMPYNDVLAEARGWSAVTLGLALPILAVSMAAAKHGSVRGRLAWAGSLAYLVYTYVEFAVSPPFTALYLVYIATFACAVPALILLVASIDIDALPAVLGDRTPRRAVAIFSLAFATLLALAWLRGIAARSIAGEFGWLGPEASVGHVVHALDLGLLVPLGVASGVLLLRRRASGYLLGSVLLVVAVCMGAALAAMVAWSAVVRGDSPLQAAPFAVVWIVSLTLAGVFYRAPSRTQSETADSRTVNLAG